MVRIALVRTMSCSVGLWQAESGASESEESSQLAGSAPEQQAAQALPARGDAAPCILPSEQESEAAIVLRAFAKLALRLHSQKIADHLVTAFGQHRFGMKLYALDR